MRIRRSFYGARLLGGLIAASNVGATEHRPKNPSAGAESQHTDAPDLRGTADKPLVIRVTQQPESPEKSAQDQHEREVKEKNDALLTEYTRDLASWTKVLALLTFGLLLAAGIQIIMFLRQLKVMRQDLEDTQTVARAAKQSAETARESLAVERGTMVFSGRAYVQGGQMRWLSHRDADVIFWRLRPRWGNSGNTPTRNLRVWVQFSLVDTPKPDDYEFPIEWPERMRPVTLPPKSEFESPFFDIKGPDLQLVKEDKKHLYVWGIAEYNDVYPETPRRITKFCVKAGPVTGDPTKYWDDKDPVEIRWGQITGQNFMDEDGAIAT
jgi:hypothetical protein